jgi:very-short-patch-repair endonuclease/ribonuclease HI
MNEKKFVFETAEETSYDLLKQYANENKMFMTDAERLLWNLLKAKGIGYKFRRQHIIGEYIVDFANLHYKLVVEVDGKYHFKGDQPVADDIRTSDLNKMGYTVIRFTNDEVLNNIHQVEWQIKNVIKKMEISYPKKETSVTPAKSKPSAGSTPSLPGGAGWASGFAWPAAVNRNSWAVDAACSGNPGPMEYQAIDLTTGAQVFHFGPLYGTNNIGEFLAIVHALALMDKQGIKDKVIYSDSYNAILWVKKKQCKTKLERTPETEQLYQIITRAEQWLRTHNITIPVMKWETKAWGEVPADFGRK